MNLRCTASRQIDELPASLIGFVVVGEFRGQALHQPRLERLFPVAQWPAASPLHDRPESLCEAWRAIGRRRNGAEGRLGADGRETDGIMGSDDRALGLGINRPPFKTAKRRGFPADVPRIPVKMTVAGGPAK